MKFKKLFILSAALPLLAGCAATGVDEYCSGGVAKDFTLYYPDLTELCAGTDLSISPNYKGEAPTLFEISEIRFECGKSDVQCFSVEPSSGTFRVTGSDDLETGNYEIDIRCTFSDESYRIFKKAVSVCIMKPVPDGIRLEPSYIKVSASVISAGSDSLPTARIIADSAGVVQIKSFVLRNVYRDGTLDNACKSWFKVDENTGVFSIVSPNPDIIPAKYVFDFKLTTYKVGLSDEDGIYASALTLDAVSAPYELTYSPSLTKVEVGLGGKSEAPVCKGTPDNLCYEIAGVTPDNTVGITIDKLTGVLSFPSPATEKLGAEYKVSVKATNEYGQKTFADALTFKVISFINPITELQYGDISGKITGLAFTNAPTAVQGDEITYSFVDLPEALSCLKIDAETGVVSCAKGDEITPGDYTVKVKAKNVKSEKTASFSLNVISNPNAFTYVLWGNNMGLTPAEDYGNQFRIEQGAPKATFNVQSSDIPAGRTVKYTAVKKTAMGNSFSMNSGTGAFTVESKAVGQGSTGIYVHYYEIQVTVGTGEEAVTKYFPLFIQQIGKVPYTTPKDSVRFEYTPFVFHVNPKTGGRSVKPVITNKAGEDVSSKTKLELYSTNLYLFNLNDPAAANHFDGRYHSQNANYSKHFIRTVYNKYYNAIGKTVNYGTNEPWSAYNANSKKYDLGFLGAYADLNTAEIVVNPEKFVDDYGYANGILAVCFKAVTDGSANPAGSTCVQIYPMILWLDSTLNE